MEMQVLKGKVVLVTGINSGIGLGMARRLVEEGAFVYITGRRPEALDGKVVEWMEKVSDEVYLSGPEAEQ